MILKHEINSHRRQKYIRVKRWLLNILVFVSSFVCYIFPDPLKAQVFDRNALKLLEDLKVYNYYERNGRCKIIVNAFVRIAVTLIEHSPNWRDRFYFFGELLRAGEWNTRALNHPRNGWGETKPYGGRNAILKKKDI